MSRCSLRKRREKEGETQREACGLCTEVAEGPNNQDPVRTDTKKVVLEWIQLGSFDQLENKGYGCIPFPSEEQFRKWERGVATFVSFGTPPIHQASALSGTLTVMVK